MKRAKPTLKARHAERKQQSELKKVYGIEDEQVVVVERKSRMVQVWKVTLKYFFLLLRILATATVAVLAVIGLAALVYPNIRAELYETATLTMYQIQEFLAR